MISAFENLPLLGDRMYHGLQGGTPVGNAESVSFDVGNNLLQSAPNGAEVLQTLIPEEPASIGRPGIIPPPGDELSCELRAQAARIILIDGDHDEAWLKRPPQCNMDTQGRQLLGATSA